MSEDRVQNRRRLLTLLVLLVAVLGLFLPLGKKATKTDFSGLIRDEVARAEENRSSVEQVKPEERDGAKIVQISEGDKVTNLTTQQHIQNIYNSTDPVGATNDTLAELSCSETQTISYVGSIWVCSDQPVSTDTDQQSLWLSGDQLGIQNANSVDLSQYKDNTDNQNLSLAVNKLSIQNGNAVDLSMYLDNTDLLASISCLAGQTTKYSGGSWVCATDNDTATIYNAGDGLQLVGNTLSISAPVCDEVFEKLTWNGTSFSCATDRNTDNQQLSWNSGTRELSLTDGDTVVISDADTNTTYSAGSGLSLLGTQFKLDPNNLSAVSSVANSDVIMIGTGSGPKKVSYNDLFGNILGALNYRGTWDASGNSPDLTSYCDSSTKGHYYVVAGAGNTNLGGFTGWDNNDWVICDGSGWQKIESTNNVNSVFGRTGSVTAQNGDYAASQIAFTPTGTLSSANVQAAIEELKNQVVSSTLPNGQIWIGDGANQATPASVGGDLSLSNTGIATISSGAVDSAKIANGTIQTVDLADSSVTTTKIVDGTIAFADWASNSCAAGQIPKFSGSSWTCAADNDSLAQLTCGTNSTPWWDSALSKWQCSQISTGNIATGGVNSSDILDGTVLFTDIGANGCVSGQIMKYSGTAWSCGTDLNSGTTYTAGSGIGINGSNVISASLGTDIVSGEIVDGTIATADIADGAITSNKILDGTIALSDLGANGCTTGQILKYNGSAWACAADNAGIQSSFSSQDITDKASGGAIGTAAATVDAATNFNINQTTAGQTLTIPNPTDTTALKGKVITINNVGSVNFTLGGVTVPAGSYGSAFVWTGSQWNPINAASNVAFGGYANHRDASATGAQNVTQNASPSYSVAAQVDLSKGSTSYSNGVTASGNVLTFEKAGKYTVRFIADINDNGGAATRYYTYIGDGGSTMYRFNQDSIDSAFAGTITNEYSANFTAGSTLDFRMVSWNGSETGLLYGYSIVVEQISGNLPINTYSAGTGVSIDGSNVISASLGTDIVSGEIVDGTIATADIADGAITSGKILDGTIVSADIADGTVTFADLASSGCTAGQVPQYNGSAWVCSIPVGSVAKFYNNTFQTSVSAGTNVALNTAEVNTISSLVSNSAGIITLQPGTYTLEGSAGGLQAASGNARVWPGFYNITSSSYIGQGGQSASGNAGNFAGAPYNSATATLTVSSVTQIALRLDVSIGATRISDQSDFATASLGRAWVKVTKN